MTITYGIVGCGMMGREHIRNIALMDDATVGAILEPDPEMGAAALALAEVVRRHDRDAVLPGKLAKKKNVLCKTRFFGLGSTELASPVPVRYGSGPPLLRLRAAACTAARPRRILA